MSTTQKKTFGTVMVEVENAIETGIKGAEKFLEGAAAFIKKEAPEVQNLLNLAIADYKVLLAAEAQDAPAIATIEKIILSLVAAL
jgi:hypothetical protein